MGTMIRRAVVPILLILGGIVSLIYGAVFHSVPVVGQVVEKVTEEQEIDVPFEPPEMFPPSPFMEQPPPPFVEPPPPIMIKKTIPVTKKVIKDVTRHESEPTLILGATVDGLPQLALGILRRPLGEGPGVEGPAKTGPARCLT